MPKLTKKNSLKKIKVAVPSLNIKEYKRIKEVILNGKIVSGKYVKEFEEKFSKFIGTNYACAVNSGTAALHTALRCLEIKPGSEVIVPAISFMSTASAVIHHNCIPKFCDISIKDYCIDTNDLKKKISNKTKAVIITHFTGNVCNLSEIKKILKKKNIPLIEDCAQAHGSKFNNKKVGSFGDISCFSFYVTKHMTTGEGGVLCFNKKKYERISKMFRNHGLKNRDEHDIVGYNYRMNEIAALIGIEQLKKVDKINNQRIQNSKYLIKSLKKIKQNWFELQQIPNYSKHTFFWLALRIINKKIKLSKVIKYLSKKGIEVRSRYNYPLYKHPLFLNLKVRGQNYERVFLSESEKLAGNIFGLPNHQKLKKNDLDYIINAVSNFK